MVPPDSSITPLESATKELLGFGELALSLQQRAEVVERGNSVRVVTPESPLLSFQSPTIELLGFG